MSKFDFCDSKELYAWIITLSLLIGVEIIITILTYIYSFLELCSIDGQTSYIEKLCFKKHEGKMCKIRVVEKFKYIL